LISDTDADSVAADVEYLVSNADVEEVYDRAGDRGLGYVDPGEAAREILDEELKPIFDDPERDIDLGFKKPALEICAGIVLGLYAVRNNDSEGVLAWAPDYPGEAAWRAASFLAELPNGESWSFPRGLIDRVQDWSEMIERAQAKERRGKTASEKAGK
jgi:hypothetical protein